MILNILR